MNVFDQFVKHDLKVKYYARYTDDFVIISDNKIIKGTCANKLFTRKLKLELHPNKVTIRKYLRG